ncbi:hypothetical protein D1007_08213 [Hordeum vulgare]|nr:hypothetical protein D1007_08213 [Hordeum vulgare]
MEFDVHHVDTHLRNTDLTVVYSDEPVVVEHSINTMEWLLAADDKYKVVGFDLGNTTCRAEHDQKVALTQLWMNHHVLHYHYFLATKPCEIFTRFVNNPDYMVATVDATNDRKVLKTSGLDYEKLIDIHDHYKFWDIKKDKDSHVDLA